MAGEELLAGSSGGGGGFGGFGGGGDFITKLLENKLFLQYLSGAGSAIQEGKPVASALNNITQQNISAQNYATVLKKLLGKALGPDESTAKLSSKGLSFDLPNSTLPESIKGGAFLGPNPLGSAGATAPTNVDDSGITGSSTLAKVMKNYETPSTNTGLVSPFAGSTLGEINASDLAGLTPKDISDAFGNSLAVERMKQLSATNAAEIAYKKTHGKLLESIIGEHTPMFEIPGTDVKLTRDEYIQWMKASRTPGERTAEIKNFEYAKANGYTGNFGDWINSKENSDLKNYDKAVSQGYTGTFREYQLEMKRAGATRISLGEKLEEKKEMGKLQGQLYFTNPDWTKDLDKHMKDFDFSTVTSGLPKDAPKEERTKAYNANLAKETTNAKIRFIESKIAGGGGAIQSAQWADSEKKTIKWTVKWPSGDTETITYGVK